MNQRLQIVDLLGVGVASARAWRRRGAAVRLDMGAMSSGLDEPGPADRLHRVAIVGCGFGGLFAAKALKTARAEVTLVERTNHHLFAPLLYQVATGILSAGEIAPADYNKSWWALRLKYQGVAPPMARSEADFDPGAKYHVAANVPYTRYFLAHILEFQFYRALCRESGYKGPLNRCTFYGSKEAGAKFNKMLAMGQSKPWPDALEVLTGGRQVDASAILEYFAPLQKWLDEENKGKPVGW